MGRQVHLAGRRAHIWSLRLEGMGKPDVQPKEWKRAIDRRPAACDGSADEAAQTVRQSGQLSPDAEAVHHVVDGDGSPARWTRLLQDTERAAWEPGRDSPSVVA